MKVLNYTATAVFVVLVFYLLVVGEALLLPLIIAITIWYLINTLSAAFALIRLGSIRIPGPICLIASICTFAAVIWMLVNFLSGSLAEVMQVIPEYQENLTMRLENLPFVDMLAIQELGLMQSVAEWIDLPAYATSIAASFAGIVANSGLIFIYVLFLFLEQGHFDNKISALFGPSKQEADVRKILQRVRTDIQIYIGIKMFASSLTGLLSYAYLKFVGVDFAGIWALIIFLLNFIPTVGSIIATIFPAMIALAQADGYTLFILVLIGITSLQIMIGNIMEPRLAGNTFNLSPIVILLNLGLWGYIWGITGMFLCVPFLIIITIILSHFPKTRPIAIILSSDGHLRVPLDKSLEGFSFSAAMNPAAKNRLGSGKPKDGADS